MAGLITGVFHEMSDASNAVSQLRAAGFSESEISVLTSDSSKHDSFALTTGSKVGEGAAVGAGVGLGIPEHEAKYYEGAIEQGGMLIGVQAEGPRRDTVREILKDNRAESISRA